MHIRNDLACSENAQCKRYLSLSHADRNFLFDFENWQRLYPQSSAPTVLRPFSFEQSEIPAQKFVGKNEQESRKISRLQPERAAYVETRKIDRCFRVEFS